MPTQLYFVLDMGYILKFIYIEIEYLYKKLLGRTKDHDDIMRIENCFPNIRGNTAAFEGRHILHYRIADKLYKLIDNIMSSQM